MPKKMVGVSFRIDGKLKQEAEKLFNDLGMSMTTAFNVFLKQSVLEKGIPFKITADPFWSDKNQEHLRKSINELEETGGTVHNIDLDSD